MLKGEQIKIDTPTLRKLIGKKVEYLLKRDSLYSSRRGTITDIIRRQVDLGNGDYIPFDSIKEIVLL